MVYSQTIQKIGGGRGGLRAKIRQIRYLVERAKRDANFRAQTARLVADLPEKDHLAEIERLVDYVKDGIRYLRDPWSPDGIEVFIDPRTMLGDVEKGQASGDCDDHVLLASALLETAGYPTRYVVGGLPPDHYRHIWIEVHSPTTGWLPVELTKKDAAVGWDPAGRFPLVETYGGAESKQMNGLGNLPPRVVARRRLRTNIRARPLPSGAYRPANALGSLGFDIPAPRSFHNSYQDTALYAGATPSDFFRATEIRAMLPEWSPIRHSPLLGLDHALADYDDLEGLFSWYKKVIKKVTSPIVKTIKPVLAPIAGVAATVVGGPVLGGVVFGTIAKVQQAKAAAKQQAAEEAAATQQAQIEAQEAAERATLQAKKGAEAVAAQAAAARRQEQKQVSSLPSSLYSTLPGPSFYQTSDGFALPPGTPDQVAVMDQEPTPKRMGALPRPGGGGIGLGGMVALAAVPVVLAFLLRRRR